MTDQNETITDCIHHWVIESPNGPVSQGVCKLCGLGSEFRNSIQETGWDRESQSSKKIKRVKKQTESSDANSEHI